jgi:HK97 gp10 family phage protein
MISFKFDTADLAKQLDKLKASSNAALRPAAQAGAQVLYEEVIERAPQSEKPRRYKGKVIQPGALKRSIYQVFSVSESSAANAVYHISWNARKAPHGQLIENGTSRSPAYPFLRPAYDAKIGDALRVSDARWTQEIQAQIQKAGL